jgi:acyl-coenzyme A thioesterase 9
LWNGTQKVGTNPMSASRDVAIIPLGSQPERRLEYLNYRDTVRFGQILEDLDTFAVWLAYKHNQAGGVAMGIPALHSPMLIVTACVDRIDMSNTKILTDNDIEMHGFVSWVGRSSIESTMTLKQNDENGISRDLLTAHFVMASRSPDGKSSVPNLGLDLQSAEEIKYFEQGKGKDYSSVLRALSNIEAHSIRRERDYYSLLHVIPTEIERATMHDLFIKTLDSKDHSIRERQGREIFNI